MIDEDWATVGSSNLDPLSLSLNLEANLIVRDRPFAAQLRERLVRLMLHSCGEIGLGQAPRRTVWRQSFNFFIFHFLRRFPVMAHWLPAHTARRKAAPLPASTNNA